MMEENFKLDIGYSDHSEDIMIPVIAACMGAKIIEKHITLDKNMKGPDHKASIEPKAFFKMVENIKRANIVLGNQLKRFKNQKFKI